MRYVRASVFVIGILSLAASVAAQSIVSAARIEGGINETDWTRAEPIAAFVQREPDEGARPTHRTEARVLFDKEAIYVSVKAFDSEPGLIKAFLTRRDVNSSSDWIRVLIDSYHDKRTAYAFAVNPVGVKIDTYHFNDTNEDSSWDAVWEVATGMDP